MEWNEDCSRVDYLKRLLMNLVHVNYLVIMSKGNVVSFQFKGNLHNKPHETTCVFTYADVPTHPIQCVHLLLKPQFWTLNVNIKYVKLQQSWLKICTVLL